MENLTQVETQGFLNSAQNVDGKTFKKYLSLYQIEQSVMEKAILYIIQNDNVELFELCMDNNMAKEYINHDDFLTIIFNSHKALNIAQRMSEPNFSHYVTHKKIQQAFETVCYRGVLSLVKWLYNHPFYSQHIDPLENNSKSLNLALYARDITLSEYLLTTHPNIKNLPRVKDITEKRIEFLFFTKCHDILEFLMTQGEISFSVKHKEYIKSNFELLEKIEYHQQYI